MGLFGSKKEGGLMDVIRCDEKDYLIWKWSPDGQPSRKENAIRYGSSLRVKDGEVAVFVYKQKDGTMQDFIEGPYDQTIKTANFPILTSIVGSAFGGSSPFQAEIYFINLAGNIRLPFYTKKEFDIADPRFLDFVVPTTAKGSIMFNISDYKGFIKLNRMINFDLEELKEQMKDTLLAYITDNISNAPSQLGIPLVQITRSINQINRFAESQLKEILHDVYGINLKRLDISEINLNKESEGYKELREVTSELVKESQKIQNLANNQNIVDQQAINSENYADSLRIQREETQRAQRLQTEMSNLTAHQINIQGDVAKTAAQSLGQMGSGMGDGGGGGGMNPAGMMTGMMMGGAVGSGMANMMGNMMQGMNQQQPPTPPAGAIAQYHVAINGQQAGPYTIEQLRQMISGGQLTRETHVWKPGMAGWETAGNVPEIANLFGAVPPPIPSSVPPAPPAL